MPRLGRDLPGRFDRKHDHKVNALSVIEPVPNVNPSYGVLITIRTNIIPGLMCHLPVHHRVLPTR